jgi:hypothetical protein
MNSASSSFLANFSLGELVKKNHSASGLICAKGQMGGGGSVVSSRSSKLSRISIEGKKGGRRYYSLEASLDEKTEMEKQ